MLNTKECLKFCLIENFFEIEDWVLTIIARTSIIINVRAIIGGENMSPAGRPKSENPRNVRLEIRLTKTESQLLEECARELNTTKTDVIVKGIEIIHQHPGRANRKK